MTRKISLIVFVLLFSMKSEAQSQDQNENNQVERKPIEQAVFPRHQWQIGSTFSNLALQQLSLDVNHRYEGNKVLGFGVTRILGSPGSEDYEFDSDPLIDRNYEGWELAIYQKLYLHRSYVDNFVYFRHGLRGDFTNHTYSREDWFEIESDGNTFLTFETRDFSDQSFRIGYDAIFGIELYHGRYSTDIFAGAAYLFQLNDGAYQTDDFLVPSYAGLKPVFGLRFSINIGPTEYDN